MGERKAIQSYKAKIKESIPGEEEKDVVREFAVLEPNLDDYQGAKKVYNRVFNAALLSDAPVREKLDDILRKQGLWDDEKQAELTSLQQKLIDAEKKLAAGGFKKSEARKLALTMKGLRAEMGDLLAPRTQLDSTSAQGQADNEQFNHLISATVVYNDTKKRVFASLTDYLNRAGQEVAIEGGKILANTMYGVDKNFEKNLPENRFLSSFGFVNDKLQLVNEDKHLVDEDNKLIDDKGNFVDEKGLRVDKFGARLNEEGDYLVEFKPFLDDDGKPVEGDWNYGKNRESDKVEDKPKKKAAPKKEVAST